MLLPQLPSQTYQRARRELVKLPERLAKLTQRRRQRDASMATDQSVAKAKNTATEVDYEVLIIGAGVSGIDMACHLNRRYGQLPSRSEQERRFLIVEKRAEIGGTWDLFKYPGIRSDSDMFTFGFAHRPWLSNKTLTDGESIKQYIKRTAEDEKVASCIRYRTEVVQLDWFSEKSFWCITLKHQETGLLQQVTSRFVIGATGYYDYAQGYQPRFEGQEDFKGQIIHPQQWSDEVAFADKRVVVIGSGATAVTLVPALVADNASQQAAHVTMLQRSPTYIASVPSEDNGLNVLKQRLKLSNEQAYKLMRAKNILSQQALYRFSKAAPKAMKTILQHKAKQDLSGSGVALQHFQPSYNPWDERLCAVPDGDLFKALHTQRADIVTDEIERFTATGIQLRSGRHLLADLIVTATGLKLQMLGGASVSIDGQPVEVGSRMTYKAVLVEGVPNMAVLFGYTNASWTLKIDLACNYVLRLLRYMDQHGYQTVLPSATSLTTGEQVQRLADTVMGSLSAGYIQRAKEVLPKQGDRYPWQVTNNYLTDRIMLKHRRIADQWLRFA